MAEEIVTVQDARALEDAIADYFHPLPQDSRWVSTEIKAVEPDYSTENHAGFMSFFFKAWTSPSFYFLDEMVLELETCLCKNDGSALEANAEIGPVNNLLHSLFSHVELKLNDSVISKNNSSYAYRAYIDSLVNTSYTGSLTYRRSELFYVDDPEDFDNIGRTDGTFDNAGLNSRAKRYQDPKTGEFWTQPVVLIGKLFHDLSNCKTPCPPGISLNVVLQRTLPEFYLLSKNGKADAQISIKKARMYIRVGVMSTPLYTRFQLKHKAHDVVMQYRRCQIVEYAINQNQEHFKSPIMVAEKPVRIVVGVLPTAVFLGNWKRNNYRHRTFMKATVKAVIRKLR